MQNVVICLFGCFFDEVQQFVLEIIMGQMCVVFVLMMIEEINNDCEKFIVVIMKGVEVELYKVGLWMINGNICDIKDFFGYIDVFGKEFVVCVINDVQIKVVQEN